MGRAKKKFSASNRADNEIIGSVMMVLLILAIGSLLYVASTNQVLAWQMAVKEPKAASPLMISQVLWNEVEQEIGVNVINQGATSAIIDKLYIDHIEVLPIGSNPDEPNTYVIPTGESAVVWAKLPKAVAPGQTVEIKVASTRGDVGVIYAQLSEPGQPPSEADLQSEAYYLRRSPGRTTSCVGACQGSMRLLTREQPSAAIEDQSRIQGYDEHGSSRRWFETNPIYAGESLIYSKPIKKFYVYLWLSGSGTLYLRVNHSRNNMLNVAAGCCQLTDRVEYTFDSGGSSPKLFVIELEYKPGQAENPSMNDWTSGDRLDLMIAVKYCTSGSIYLFYDSINYKSRVVVQF